MKVRRIHIIACLSAFVSLAALTAASATWYADASRPDDTGDGTSWGTAKQKIESAVALAGAGDTVMVAGGNYTPAAEIAVANAITVVSANGAEFTFVNGAGANRCFNLSHTNAVVDGFTMTNGVALQGGGVVATRGVVRNCRLFRNTATSALYGGGGAQVWCNNSSASAVIEDCVISNNLVNGWGGGLLVQEYGEARNCTIVNNSNQTRQAGVVLYRGGIMSNCVIRANQTNGVAVFSQSGRPMAVMRNCFVADHVGADDGEGSGMHMYGDACTALVVNCTFSNNWTRIGAGVNVELLDVMFEDCRFLDNTAKQGAGVHIAGTYVQHVTFTNCVFAGNLQQTAGFGAGGTPGGSGLVIFKDGVVVDVVGCVFSNNTDESAGGALKCSYYDPLLTVRSCEIVNNISGGSGGGAILAVPRALLINCVLRGNHGTAAGGGVTMSAGVIRNCLITQNTAGNFGAGVNISGGTVDCCTVVGNIAVNNAGGFNVGNANPCIVNSIITSNSAATPATVDFRFQSGGETCVWYSCSPSAPPNTGNTTNNPRFLDYAATNYHLIYRSPCRNTGLNEAWMASEMDLDGQPRINGGTVDMGAYEYVPPSPGTIISIM